MKRSGLHYLIPLAIVVALVMLLVRPVAENVVRAWAVKDVNLRASLIGNSLTDGIIEALTQPKSARAQRQFSNLAKDDRLHALGFCDVQGTLTNSSENFPGDYRCGAEGEAEKGRWISTPEHPHLYINSFDVAEPETNTAIGRLVLVHDLAYANNRAEVAGGYVQTSALALLAAGLGLFAAWSMVPKWLRRRREQTRRKAPPRILTDADINKTVTVIIPALNEEKRISDVVKYALSDPATAEVIVIDDSSIDNTAALAKQAGAKVLLSSMLGKGVSMKDGIAPAEKELLVYLDGDLAGLRPNIISDLAAPLLRDEADFVKARFGRGGGRVTELTAKPMLKIFFPELAGYAQPLGGIIAGRKSLLGAMQFEDGYGVDIGLLIDAHLAGARIAEVDIGSLEHDSQPLQDLAVMVNDVGGVIFNRARKVGRMHVEQVAAMYESQRQATAAIEYVMTRRKNRTKLLLLDMDGTVTASRFAVELAKSVNQEEALAALLDKSSDKDAATRTESIANVFKYTHRKIFEDVAHGLEIRPGVIAFVNQMRRRGFMVGLISDSYFVAAEIMRRRIFADFALAHLIQFENGVCSGEIKINPAFIDEDTGVICKSNVLKAFREEKSPPHLALSWAVGDNVNDLALLRQVDKGFVIEPKSSVFDQEPGIQRISSFEELLMMLPDGEDDARSGN